MLVNISVGQGNWATVPWIAILNSKITQTTQEGIYVVFLISSSLDTIFLTLNQGTTVLVNELGQREAQKQMLDVSSKARPLIEELAGKGFTLDNNIDLGGGGWLGRNYEVGTIAYAELSAAALPSDDEIQRLLEAILEAYDKVVDAPKAAEAKPKSEFRTIPTEPYQIEAALTDLFTERSTLERVLSIWETKRNIILQGAPGVGKSFIARRLAFLLLGETDAARIEAVQFHQSYSYEDFVQGYRPTGNGGYEVKDGAFFRFCEKARVSPSRRHVFIIDEINRGNLSKILGELMLLIERDKRGPAWATSLTYSKPEEPRFYIQENVFLLGMMNTADRSLSIVDYALRRRFAFVTLGPMFESAKFRDALSQRGVPNDVIAFIVSRMTLLNKAIAEDRTNLGPGYQIGHSFFVPQANFEYEPSWYRQIIETEIQPLLYEYWFDDPDKAQSWHDHLLQGVP